MQFCHSVPQPSATPEDFQVPECGQASTLTRDPTSASEGQLLLSHLAMIWGKQNRQTEGILEAGIRSQSLFVIYWEREVFKHFKHAEGSTVIF